MISHFDARHCQTKRPRHLLFALLLLCWGAAVLGGCNIEDTTSGKDTSLIFEEGQGDDDAIDQMQDCDVGQTLCADECVDTSSDPDHCGGCLNNCIAPPMASPICQGGECDFVCEPGLTRCGDQCVDLETNPDFCGDCETQCPAPQSSVPICVEGNCDFSCAASGLERCGDACVDTQTSASSCGDCSTTCSPGEVCADGQCVLDCPAGTTQCGNDCVDLDSNHSTCGSCDNACAPGSETCIDGQCACASGYTDCGGRCVNLNTDRHNCGECNNQCGTRGACLSGSCFCDQGETACLKNSDSHCSNPPCPIQIESYCADINSDRWNCGACNMVCGHNQKCCNGTCIPDTYMCLKPVEPIKEL